MLCDSIQYKPTGAEDMQKCIDMFGSHTSNQLISNPCIKLFAKSTYFVSSRLLKKAKILMINLSALYVVLLICDSQIL